MRWNGMGRQQHGKVAMISLVVSVIITPTFYLTIITWLDEMCDGVAR